MSQASDWDTIAQNLRTELLNETTRRKNITAAGDPPPTTYSAFGRSVDWNGYFNAMMEAIAKAEAQGAAGDPFEIITHGYV